MKFVKRLMVFLLAAAILAAAGGAGYYAYMSASSNSWNAATVGELPAPRGFERVEAEAGSFLEYARGLPLKPSGAKLQYHTGGDSRLQALFTAVIDVPTLSNAEQCADVCLHLRAEWLWRKGLFPAIRFTNCSGHEMRYGGGASGAAFESYLRDVYRQCNTRSIYAETSPREVKDVQAGDVLVAYAGLRWWAQGGLGHAVMVVDVAKDRKGRTAVLIAEGNTPARSMHILRNPNPLLNPWHVLDEGGDRFLYGLFHREDLRHW